MNCYKFSLIHNREEYIIGGLQTADDVFLSVMNECTLIISVYKTQWPVRNCVSRKKSSAPEAIQ